MENNETPEQAKIRELEAQVHTLQMNQPILEMTNIKLGYSVRLMSDFHLSKNDKQEIADAIDGAQSVGEVQAIYDSYVKKYTNKDLEEDSDFQWSNDFKDNLRYYYAVSLGYDPISKIASNIQKVADYFSFENKIRSTPDAAVRKPMTDKLLEDRVGVLKSVNDVIDVVNSFNENEES